MRIKKIQVTATDLDKLIDSLQDLPAEPIVDHISDREFIDYVMQKLTLTDIQRVDNHLECCPDCTAEVERLLEASEVWREESRSRLYFPEAVRQMSESLRSLSKQLKASNAAAARASGKIGDTRTAPDRLELRMAASGESYRIWDWKSEDGSLRGHAVVETNGDLLFLFDSERLGFEGKRFDIRLGSLQWPVVLERVSPTEVGAEVSIPRDQQPENLTEISVVSDGNE